ncbi:MAG: ATP-binding protein [Chitinophagales bacterium]|jgi:signal transduction histidine kinase|nr:ATP-binding protein [Chitinophagales bacterium]
MKFELLSIFIALVYLIGLFLLAYWVERKEKWRHFVMNSNWIYALSLSIYCTAWTYYGSIGSASNQGVRFLTIYLGPTLIMPLWYLMTKKMSRISRIHNITTFVDLISLRFTQHISLGIYITAILILGIVPYIALQIKAISESFDILVHSTSIHPGISRDWLATILVITLGIFIILFASKKMDSTEHHSGIVASVAFESMFKLIAFFTAGMVICFSLFKSPSEIYHKIYEIGYIDKFTLQSNEYFEWFALIILSGIAFTLLPRQFQVAVLENHDEKHLNTAIWQFPLYLFLINLFVIPIAFAGIILLKNQNVQADYYILSLPISVGMPFLGIFVFLGGFSAAVAMVVIETVALSNMLSNNLILPILIKLNGFSLFQGLEQRTNLIKHSSVAAIMLMTWIFYSQLSPSYSLVSIGLISFVLIAQFFPTIIGVLYLKITNVKAVVLSISGGFIVWLYTLILPTLSDKYPVVKEFISQGLFGIKALNAHALFGIEFQNAIVHGFFWSFLVNLLLFFIGTYMFKPSSFEMKQAQLFVDIFKYTSFDDSRIVYKDTAAISDIQNLLERFMGVDRTKLALNSFSLRHKIDASNLSDDPRLIPFTERILSKIIGSVSAKILLESILKHRDVGIYEMLDLIEESKETIRLNRELTKKQNELEKAKEDLQRTYNQLLLHTELKDEFLATVSHELKSPITSISSFSEILQDSQSLSQEEIVNFSAIINKESARITRLINQLLDLEKYESGSEHLHMIPVNIDEWIEDIENAISGELKSKNIKLLKDIDANISEILIDRDKVMQVMINLLSNAIKFSPERAEVKMCILNQKDKIIIEIIDQGKGIEPEYRELIFEKFFQARHQSIKKPKGSGLGLAISKKIVHLHRGTIYVKSSDKNGSVMTVELPKDIITKT